MNKKKVAVSLIFVVLIAVSLYSVHITKNTINKTKFKCVEWKTWCEAWIDCKSLYPVGEDEEGNLWELTYVNQTFDENCTLHCIYALNKNETRYYIELGVSYGGFNKKSKCVKSALYCDGFPEECNRRYGI